MRSKLILEPESEPMTREREIEIVERKLADPNIPAKDVTRCLVGFQSYVAKLRRKFIRESE